jgi:hypothetical protein
MKKLVKENVIYIIFGIIAFLCTIILTVPALAETYQPVQPAFENFPAESWLHTQEGILEVMREMQITLNQMESNQVEKAYAQATPLFWLVSLTAFSIGISIISIFATTWGRIK